MTVSNNVILAYLMTTAAFQLLFGKFYTFFPIKCVYLVAISIFELGSLICGVAPNSEAFIVGRALAGLGSAGIFFWSHHYCCTLCISSEAADVQWICWSHVWYRVSSWTSSRRRAYGQSNVSIYRAVSTTAVLTCPRWRWCFYINLPIGAITILVIAIFFKAPERKPVATLTWGGRLAQLDLLGTLFFIPAIVCLLLALQWGGFKYQWNKPRIIVLFVLFGILISIFLSIQFCKTENATIPTKILKKRSVAAACWFAFCLGSSFFIMIYFTPVWLQAVQGVSAVESGIRNLPMDLGLVIVSIISGIGVSTLGYCKFVIFCLGRQN